MNHFADFASVPRQVLEFQADAVDGKAVAATWLAALPLTTDELEGTVAHEQLVRLLEASDPRCVIFFLQHLLPPVLVHLWR